MYIHLNWIVAEGLLVPFVNMVSEANKDKNQLKLEIGRICGQMLDVSTDKGQLT